MKRIFFLVLFLSLGLTIRSASAERQQHPALSQAGENSSGADETNGSDEQPEPATDGEEKGEAEAATGDNEKSPAEAPAASEAMSASAEKSPGGDASTDAVQVNNRVPYIGGFGYAFVGLGLIEFGEMAPQLDRTLGEGGDPGDGRVPGSGVHLPSMIFLINRKLRL